MGWEKKRNALAIGKPLRKAVFQPLSEDISIPPFIITHSISFVKVGEMNFAITFYTLIVTYYKADVKQVLGFEK